MNLVLIGYRGTGKSVIGHRLGRLLKMPVISLDEEIVRHTGQRIPDLVAAHGWPHFRDVEEEICRRFGARDHQILDCGGGVVERPGNAPMLRAHGRVFFLKASPATIVARIGGDKNRPSLTGAKSFTDEVSEVLERRTPLYQAMAHETVETDGKNLDDLAAYIAQRWKAVTSPDGK
jgi:shikimate kinase